MTLIGNGNKLFRLISPALSCCGGGVRAWLCGPLPYTTDDQRFRSPAASQTDRQGFERPDCSSTQKMTGKGVENDRRKMMGSMRAREKTPQLPLSSTLGHSQELHLRGKTRPFGCPRSLTSQRISVTKVWILPAGTPGPEFGKEQSNLP